MKKTTVIPSAFLPVLTICKRQKWATAIFTCVLFITTAQAQDRLVGVTSTGGADGAGAVFSINTSGTQFSILKNFADWGSLPSNDLTRGADGNLYGVIAEGGTYGSGVIYRMDKTGGIIILKHLNMAVDGGYPRGGLLQASDGNFYGLASAGSINNGGCIFKISPSGTYTVIRSLNLNVDGGRPRGHLIEGNDGNFYGMNNAGGASGYGTLFKLTPGGVYSVLKSFNAADGITPYGSLLQAKDGNLYGMTNAGGMYNRGTLFCMTPGGSFTVLHHFASDGIDGQYPKSDVIQAKDGFLYGMTPNGGTYYNGTIFKIRTNGTGYTILRAMSASLEGASPQGSLIQAKDGHFYGTAQYLSGGFTGSIFKMTKDGKSFSIVKKLILATDGGYPAGSLVQGADGQLYGTNNSGGKDGDGTIFKTSVSGNFTVLTHLNGSAGGNMPQDNLALGQDSAYYGVTTYGGTYNYGTIFKICRGKTTVLHSFNMQTDGSHPDGGLVKGTDGNLYGCTASGGTHQYGTIYKITNEGKFTVLRHLASTTDGGRVHGSLVVGTDGALYGTTATGGTGNAGTIFRMTNSGAFSVLHNFAPATEGSNPEAGLTLGSDGLLYGITGNSPRFFKITNTGIFTIIRSFTYAEGTLPYGSLAKVTDGIFYGTFSSGGTNGHGTIFKITSTGNFTKLRDLNSTTDGSYPKGGLAQASDGNFYGTTSAGGGNKAGTIFKITPAGTYNVLRHLLIDKDGGAPQGGLLLAPANNLVANAQNVTTSEDISKVIILNGSGGSNLLYNIVANPKNGKITGGSAAKRTYTPNANFNGTDSFSFVVHNGCPSSVPAWVSITVTPVNDTPVLAPIGNKTVEAGAKLSFKATASDVDNGQSLRFSLINAPAGAVINAVSGAFSWTPATAGSYTFAVRVTDNGAPVLWDEETITVTVTNANLTANKVEGALEPWNRVGKSSLYPNPVMGTGVLDIKTPGNCTIQILDMTGRMLSTQRYFRNTNPVQIDAGFLPPGVYLLKIWTADGESETLRFTKM